jgi:hypothetical protein
METRVRDLQIALSKIHTFGSDHAVSQWPGGWIGVDVGLDPNEILALVNAGFWVVEVYHPWLNRFRKILVRFEKNLATHLGLVQFARAYIVLKRAGVFR